MNRKKIIRNAIERNSGGSKRLPFLPGAKRANNPGISGNQASGPGARQYLGANASRFSGGGGDSQGRLITRRFSKRIPISERPERKIFKRMVKAR